MSGEDVGHAISHNGIVLVSVVDLRFIGQRHGDEVPVIVVIVIEQSSVAGHGLDDVGKHVEIEFEEIAVAALDAAQLPIIGLGVVHLVAEHETVAVRVRPRLEIGAGAVESARAAGHREGHHLESAHAAIGADEVVIGGTANQIGDVVVEQVHR